ncbi:MAG: LPS export ABC transporter permease LptF [Myxococcales bacterium]|nr:LPS export ABC transporter permease LptF [Myxococcales bacterium]
MKRTLFRYMLLEVLGPFAIGLVILTFVLLMFQLLKLTELIVSYGVGLGDVGRILVYIFPPFFTFTVPMSFLLAVLMAVSRLSSDSELTAMKAGGISLYQIYPPILLLSLVMTLATAGLALYADPWGKSSFKNLLLQLGKEKATIGIVEHVFNDSLDDMTLYVHHLVPEEDRLEGLFLADERQPGAPLFVIAEAGRILSGDDSAMQLEMTNGVMHRTDPADPTVYETVQFKKYRLRVDLTQTMKEGKLKRTYLEMGLGELRQYVETLRKQGDTYDMRRAWVEYHRRFAMPFACLAFGLIGLPLGVSPPRSGRSRGFSTSIVMLCVFYLLFRAGENLGWKGVLHPAAAMWLPIAILLAVGVYLLVKKAGERPVWLLDLVSESGRRAMQWLRRKAGFHDPEQPEGS